MPEEELHNALRSLPTGNFCDAHPAVRAMSAEIRPLFPGARLAGPARTVFSPPGQNAAVHRAIAGAVRGEVLVIGAGGSREFGLFGDILAQACRHKGIAGVVIDGAVRDAGEIISLGFPVFCLGTKPVGTRKTEPGEVNVPLRCGGLVVEPGEWIVGDDDGVVVIPRDLAREIATAAMAVAAREVEIMSQLARGRTTCEILDIPIRLNVQAGGSK